MSESTATLVYDGDCGSCRRSAAWIARHWPEGGPEAVPWQGLGADVLLRMGLTPDDLDRAAWWIHDGRRDEGAQAVARALVAAGGSWAWVGSALLHPPFSWLAPLGYRVVARNRHRLPGGTPTCRV